MAGTGTMVRFKDDRSSSDKVGTVLQLLQKDVPLSKKQLEFCSPSCIERFLKAKGNSAHRAAKQLKATLAWRETLDIGYLIADEFAAELAVGAAFVAGHDNEGRPVMVIRKRQESAISRSQKNYLRFIVFTAEVALASMACGVHQWVLIVDITGVPKISSSSVSSVFSTLKLLAEHYPERLSRVFIVDASSVFHFFWKGISPFLDHSIKDKLSFVYSKDYAGRDNGKGSRVSSTGTSPFAEGRSQRFKSVSCTTPGGSPYSGPLKSDKDASLAPVAAITPGRLNGAALISNHHARSYSFSNPTANVSQMIERREVDSRSFRIDTRSRVISSPAVTSTKPRKLRSSWDLVTRLKREDRFPGEEREVADQFGPYLQFHLSVYNETSYRALMRPPLGGLASLVSPELKRKNASFHQPDISNGPPDTFAHLAV